MKKKHQHRKVSCPPFLPEHEFYLLTNGLLLDANLITVLLSAGVKGFNVNQPGHSCKDIRDSGNSKGDGEYRIDPEKDGHPFKVFCDMTTDGGNLRIIRLKGKPFKIPGSRSAMLALVPTK